ncbi:glycosyltransferase [Mesobaculum littorinae]|uniref:Glycosyltransferase n=1 Tax=Mesobaculum littorinae TaxID=2486419 RepID=A0A438AD04_9RHOB|nr:glycosyltransferase [Mesobaculum littorinae]RVV96564.1 glycosyltransferase [Mesobaculum littorinae]
MAQLRILHLIDDTSPGGVMRMLDHMTGDPRLAALGHHEVVKVARGRAGRLTLEADLVISHMTLNWRSLPGLMSLRARHAHLPIVQIEHSYSGAFMQHNVTQRDRFVTMLRTAYALFDKVVAVSAGQGAWMEDFGLIHDRNLRVISPCVDLSAFLKLAAPAQPRPRVLGAIGRFDTQKGFGMLIEAFRRVECRDAELHMIGDGPERRRLEMLARGDARIRFLGFAADPAQAMARVDAVAMPSQWEPYGLVGLEARAAGRPLLAAKVDGLRDQIRGGAIAVNPGAPAWASAIKGLLSGAEAGQTDRARRDAADAGTRFAAGWAALTEELVGPAEIGAEADQTALQATATPERPRLVRVA